MVKIKQAELPNVLFGEELFRRPHDSLLVADELAVQTRESYGLERVVGFAAIKAIAEDQGWTVRKTRFDAAKGGLRALLLPRFLGGFDIPYDPDWPGVVGDFPQDNYHAALIGHEIAHSLFFDKAVVPHRSVFSPHEKLGHSKLEAFCDRYGARLVAGDDPLFEKLVDIQKT